MSRQIPFIFLLILLASGVAACGSKGALVMPDQQASSKKKHAPKPAPSAPAPATSDDTGKPR